MERHDYPASRTLAVCHHAGPASVRTQQANSHTHRLAQTVHLNGAGSESRTGWKLPHRQHVARGKFVPGDADFDAQRLGAFAGLDVEFPRFPPLQVRLSSAHQFASSNENGNGGGCIGGGAAPAVS